MTLVALDQIDDTRRLRPVVPAWAEVMADDLANGAVLPPVVLRPARRPDVRVGCLYALVIGGHRMAAHRLLGLTTIRAEVREMSAAEARIAEVDENLKRHELNALDRAVMLLERKLAWEELHPETKHGGDVKHREKLRNSKSQTLRLGLGRFSAEAADRVGLSERTVQADVELASKLSPEAIALIRATPLVDNAAELRRLAAHDARRQALIAREIAGGRASNVSTALIAIGAAPTGEGDPQEDLFRRACSLWQRMDKRTQQRLVAHIAGSRS